MRRLYWCRAAQSFNRADMAAPILSYEGLGLVQGSGWLFRGLDVHVGARDRLALIGRNGDGSKGFVHGQLAFDHGAHQALGFRQNPALFFANTTQRSAMSSRQRIFGFRNSLPKHETPGIVQEVLLKHRCAPLLTGFRQSSIAAWKGRCVLSRVIPLANTVGGQ